MIRDIVKVRVTYPIKATHPLLQTFGHTLPPVNDSRDYYLTSTEHSKLLQALEALPGVVVEPVEDDPKITTRQKLAAPAMLIAAEIASEMEAG